MSLVLMAFLTATQGASAAPSACIASSPDPAVVQVCLGEDETRRAAEAPQASADRAGHLKAAAEHYRRASDVGSADLKLKALTKLAETYDVKSLNDLIQRETVLRELIAFVPTDPRFAFDLAALQESQGSLDAAEDTLLATRQRHATEIEAYKKLAQFYARRVSTLDTSRRDQRPPEGVNPGEPDEKGVYRVGGQLSPPPRVGTPRYPDDAQVAGIQGGVQAEILIDLDGHVADARIVKSIPLLDEPALKAVREWRFEPTIVDGQPVPVRMVVTVNFTLR